MLGPYDGEDNSPRRITGRLWEGSEEPNLAFKIVRLKVKNAAGMSGVGNVRFLQEVVSR